MKRTFIPLMLCVAFALLLAACGGSDNSSNTSTTNTSNKATTNTAATTNTTSSTTNTSATTNTSSTSSSGEKIGVAECDEFLAKYEACISGKVPEAARAQYKSGMEQWRESWKKLAANPQTKATLTQVCKTQLETAKTSMKSFGCDF